MRVLVSERVCERVVVLGRVRACVMLGLTRDNMAPYERMCDDRIYYERI